MSSDGSTAVTIYGRTYNLRGSGDTAYLGRLAELVDGRMREVADATGTPDTTKVAILAALNIADDCLQARRSGFNEEVQERLVDLVARIDEVLADPGCRPRSARGERAE